MYCIMEFTPDYIRRLQRRDQQAFSDLYTAMVDRFYRYLAGRFHLDRQGIYDLIGDFFVKLRDRIDRVDPNQSFESWIWTVFRNYTADYFKTKKHDQRLDGLDEILKDTALDPLQQAHNTTQLQRIYKALDRLDELSKEIVLLKYVEGLSFEDIARITKVQPDTVRQRASRAIKAVQELLR